MASVDVDAQNLEFVAAIRPTCEAWRAPAAKIIGFHRAQRSDRRTSCSGFHHLHAQFMTEDARVGKQRLLAGKRVDICAADPAPQDPDQRLSSGCDRLGNCFP